MADPNDWRLSGQERYLRGVELCHRAYRRYPKNPSWDHDHCSFCRAEFTVEDSPEALREGYCTLDDYHWICDRCFHDFKGLFGWRVAAAPPADA
jgi:hypothetical protein